MRWNTREVTEFLVMMSMILGAGVAVIAPGPNADEEEQQEEERRHEENNHSRDATTSPAPSSNNDDRRAAEITSNSSPSSGKVHNDGKENEVRRELLLVLCDFFRIV